MGRSGKFAQTLLLEESPDHNFETNPVQAPRHVGPVKVVIYPMKPFQAARKCWIVLSAERVTRSREFSF